MKREPEFKIGCRVRDWADFTGEVLEVDEREYGDPDYLVLFDGGETGWRQECELEKE